MSDVTARAAPAEASADADIDTNDASEPMRTSLWRPVTCLVICVLGIAASIYLTYLHYAPAAISCPLGGTNSPIDCSRVLTSAQSVLLGIPIPFYGLAFFVAMFAMCLPVAWRSTSMWLARGRLASVVAGIGMVIYLVSQELLVIRKICIWCTSVHILTFVLFLIVATGWEDTGWARSRWADEDADD